MNLNDDLIEEDLVKFAVKHYYSPKGRVDPSEFYDDLNRFKYIKRLLNRYIDTGNLSERLLLNHLIVVFNVFGSYACIKIFSVKLEEKHWPAIKPFLKYLNMIRPEQLDDISSDEYIIEKLKEI